MQKVVLLTCFVESLVVEIAPQNILRLLPSNKAPQRLDCAYTARCAHLVITKAEVLLSRCR